MVNLAAIAHDQGTDGALGSRRVSGSRRALRLPGRAAARRMRHHRRRFGATVIGVSFYGYRHSSPAMGRWLTRDPIGIQGGTAPYGFVRNLPIGLRDTLGLQVDRTSHVIIYGGLENDAFDAAYRRLPFYRGEDPGPAAGAASLWFEGRVGCDPCESWRCSKLVVRTDTFMEAQLIWRLRSRYRGRESGRTPEQHERLHLRHLDEAATRFDTRMHLAADGVCVPSRCCNAKYDFVNAAYWYEVASMRLDEVRVDFEDYPAESLDELHQKYQDAYVEQQAKYQTLVAKAAEVRQQCHL